MNTHLFFIQAASVAVFLLVLCQWSDIIIVLSQVATDDGHSIIP